MPQGPPRMYQGYGADQSEWVEGSASALKRSISKATASARGRNCCRRLQRRDEVPTRLLTGWISPAYGIGWASASKGLEPCQRLTYSVQGTPSVQTDGLLSQMGPKHRHSSSGLPQREERPWQSPAGILCADYRQLEELTSVEGCWVKSCGWLNQRPISES